MEQKHLNHQRELELQEQAHRQKLEQQRMAEENKEREYQRKLQNAPKKAIYSPVSQDCPKCTGKRHIDLKSGQAICPYCDYVEQLIVDHYEIDQDAFQKQLQEEEEKRKSIIKRKNDLSAGWVAIGISSTAFLYLIILGYLFASYVCIAIIAVTLASLYPKLHPILWGIVFPVPLTSLLISNEKIKVKLPFWVRLLLIILAWILYLGLLSGLFFYDAGSRLQL